MGPPKLQIWCDLGAIAPADTFGPAAENALANSDTLLVVLSNNWIHSEWCKRELDLFRQQHQNESADQVKRRVVVVGKSYIEQDARPHLLQGQEGYQFITGRNEDGRYLELFKAGKQDAAFYDQVQDLAYDLWKRTQPSERDT